MGLYSVNGEQNRQTTTRDCGDLIYSISFDMGNFRVFIFLGVISLALKCASGASTSLDTIFFRYYNKNGTHTDINIQNVTLLISKLDLTKWTTFYIHGYNENVESTSVITVTNAYSTTDINVVAVDYGEIAANNILVILGLVGPVGQAVAQSLNKLEGSGLDQNKIHVIGHSLGGAVSAEMSVYLNFTLPRITGLDPSGRPLYPGRFLTANDAKFVDIIHTDKMFYGELYNSGSVDFNPNYGRRIQPGCPYLTIPLSDEDFCSHHRSWRFYAESVRNPSGFLAVQCADDFSFLTNSCNYSNIIPMGFETPSNATGVYYLHTNSQSPFARGLQGTRS
ncbi:pancreatic triacylglycerol lipase-like isoform X2 [Halictus rubicundus]|uniref:pancreatic triacylglycerol lipase-like isoform X2 n=1 Tax=Halictus rubicundus TaxID=77578 RepID=UPI004036D637